MYLCTRNYDLKRGGTFETAKAGTFHSVTAGTSIPLFTCFSLLSVFLIVVSFCAIVLIFLPLFCFSGYQAHHRTPAS